MLGKLSSGLTSSGLSGSVRLQIVSLCHISLNKIDPPTTESKKCTRESGRYRGTAHSVHLTYFFPYSPCSCHISYFRTKFRIMMTFVLRGRTFGDNGEYPKAEWLIREGNIIMRLADALRRREDYIGPTEDISNWVHSAT
jgi:hypothetical protein